MLEENLKQNPRHTPILLRLSELARERGEIPEAVRYLKELVASDPKNVEAHLELGRALYETNEVQGAIDQTAKILDLDPKHTDAMYNLGAIYGNINRNGAQILANGCRRVTVKRRRQKGRQRIEGVGFV